jgi:predicted amidohydrolase YtcJ
MSTKPYDLVLRGGTVATASAVFPADVAIEGETIAAVGRNLGPGAQDIDVRGKLVLPGGIDSHAHIEQVSAAGILNADTFESATVSTVRPSLIRRRVSGRVFEVAATRVRQFQPPSSPGLTRRSRSYGTAVPQ